MDPKLKAYDYRLVVATNILDLEGKVCDLLKDDYCLQGGVAIETGPVIGKNRYVQAMVRYHNR